MWTKNEDDQQSSQGRSAGPEATAPGPRGMASLGPSITIKGTLTGKEDLLIEGRVDGEISVKDHSITVGPSGKVKANVYGKNICVEGQVNGDLQGEDQVVIRKTGKVEGNLTAPRVTLENGSKFRGSIDMQPRAEGSTESSKPSGKEARAARVSGGARS